MSTPSPRRRMSGFGRVLVIFYAIMALAATGRSIVQILRDFEAAPLAYTLSFIAAIVYIVATLALVFSDRPRGHGLAWIAIMFELTGVLVVGTLSIVVPELFAADATVWSWYGFGYLFIPVVLPILGLWWLARHLGVRE